MIVDMNSDRYHLVPDLKRAGISYDRIAAAAGCTKQNVSLFIQGRHSSKRVAVAISRLAKIPLSEIIEEAA
jgi:hypothetical protein